MERPPEIRQALRQVTAYLEQLEVDLAAERRARQLAELKLKAAQAGRRPPRPPATPSVPTDPLDRALALLGLTGRPSEQEIRQAYRQQARTVHPDIEGGSPEAFQELTTAQELLLRELPA
ncbi:DnaJ domain-containing protein [Cyanobium sp. WKJ7-Wakatipu]|uniref:DnaJ domain-containing protein n=1 Tax=Cyanobium sp. WKJ7-Wakatipu TaxID=2823726 RepID=UPI0020CE3711|nr:DnaJ domain-containing protein [Cyanobium sp. WKJ7-Wakatipu]MCP9782866.1 DnaJ domain-containing protein [Cyanobium sp. WKJ7-Wakatipu]